MRVQPGRLRTGGRAAARGPRAGSGPGLWPLAVLPRAWGLCSGAPCPPGPMRPCEEPECFLGHPVVQAKHGGRGLVLRAASGLVNHVVWLIRKRVCVCACVCVCSHVCAFLECASPCQCPGMGGGLARCLCSPVQQDILFAPRARVLDPTSDPWSHLCLATPSPRMAPYSSRFGSAWLPPVPMFPGAPSWTEGHLWSLALSLWVLDEAGGQ